MREENLQNLQNNIGFSFLNDRLLILALTHRSHVNESSKKEHNERIEFLGDAVLELVVTEYLYNNFPNKPEGELTSIRSALVCGEHHANIAKKFNLGDYLFLSRGEEKSGGRNKDYLLANTVESIIGAIYLDQGFASAKTFIEKFILIDTEEILEKKTHIDSKSHFQELAQEKKHITPIYKLEKENGPDHDKIFTMSAYIGEEKISMGSGGSKKEAEMEAAKNALKKLNWE